MWQSLKTQNVTKVKKKLKNYKTQRLKFYQNNKNLNLTRPKKSKLNKTKNLKM